MLATKRGMVVPGPVSIAKETVLVEQCGDVVVYVPSSPFGGLEVLEAGLNEVADACMGKNGMGNGIEPQHLGEDCVSGCVV
jgi:hypothetical protein